MKRIGVIGGDELRIKGVHDELRVPVPGRFRPQARRDRPWLYRAEYDFGT